MGLFRRLQPPEKPTASPGPNLPVPTAPPVRAPATPAATPAPVAAVAPPPASGAPAPPPAAATPAPSAATNALTAGVRAVAEQLKSLSKDMQTDRALIGEFTQKVSGMENRMKSLHNLSELLSMRYNPFLGEAEDSAFGGRLPRLDEPKAPTSERTQGGGPAGAAPRTSPAAAGEAAARVVVPEAGPSHLVGAPAFDEPRQAAPHPVAAPAPAPAPTRMEHAPSSEPAYPSPRHAESNGHAHLNGHGPGPRAAAQQAPPPRWDAWPTAPPAVPAASEQGPRMAFLVLSWFEHMLESVNPAALPAFLDYYHAIGWVPDDAHAWMLRLADGVAPRRSDATPKSFMPADPRKLVHMHRENLRFLDFLFNGQTGDEEPSRREKAARVVLGRR